MKLIVCKDYDEMSRQAAELIAAQVKLFPQSVLGLATGSTPLGTYRELIKLYNEDKLDFSEIETINLDEYVGLGPNHDQSYRYFMNKNFFDQINIDPDMTHVPNGICDKPEEEAERYECLAEYLGGIDLQLLGLGGNGHIGFNEPDTAFCGPCHVVNLKKETIEANARFFASEAEVPKQAITMGIKQIMKAKKIVMIVSGAQKAEALKATVVGPIVPSVPASILQLHSDVTIFADEEASSWIYDM